MSHLMGLPSEFISVPIEMFINGVICPSDVFVRLGEDKHVQVLKAGEVFDPKRLENYKGHHLGKLYVRLIDHGAFVKKSILIAGVLLEHPNLSSSARTTVLSRVAESVLGEVFALNLTEEIFENAKDVTKSVVLLADSKPELTRLLENLNKVDESVLRHSIAVAVVGPMIAIQMGWTRRETLEKIALGGLLHDVGLKELSPELLSKQRHELTFEEIKIYESHPFRGMQICEQLGIVPDDVMAILSQHHENSIGQGYPRHLWDLKISPLARVVALADTFCDFTVTSTTRPVPKKSAEALHSIEVIMGQPFNKDCYKALRLLAYKKLQKSAV